MTPESGDGDSPPRPGPTVRDILPRRAPGLRWPIVGATAGVAAAVLLAAVAGYLPGTGPTGSAPSSFASARAAAESAARTFSGGPWQAWWTVGFDPSSPTTLPLNYTYVPIQGSACSYAPLQTGNRTVESSGNVSVGSTSAWSFVFRNSSAVFLLVSVVDGAATLAGTFSGTGCPFAFPEYEPLPTGLVDPTEAAGRAARVGGYAFLAHHPEANVTILGYAAALGIAPPGPYWLVNFTSCPSAPSSSVSGAFFWATVNASSGALLRAANATGPCARIGGTITTPLSEVLAVTPAYVSQVGGTFTYNFSVRSVTAPLRLGDLAMAVQNGAGTPVTPADGRLEVLLPSGALLGVFNLTTQAWESGGSAALANGDTISLSTTQTLSGQGDWLTITGRGTYTGSVSVAIP